MNNTGNSKIVASKASFQEEIHKHSVIAGEARQSIASIFYGEKR